ncbi:MAG: hypothetical protein M3Y91_17470, partial [Actinomycetota bacterium]|nr:hypothetical protein [Actinomycetota bacterium]
MSGLLPAVPAAAVVIPTVPNAVITVFSDPGDSVGGGIAHEFDPSNSSAAGDLSTTGFNLSVTGGPNNAQNFGFRFAPPAGATLQPGYYAGARDVPETGAPILSVTGNAGCDSEGAFDIRDLATTGGSITRLDVVYEQRCNNSTSELFGEIKIGEAPPNNLLVASSSIRWPSVGLGGHSTAVPVTVRNLGATPVSMGTTALGGANPSDFNLGPDNCSGAVLAPQGACQVFVDLAAPTQGPVTAQLQLLAGGAVRSVQLDGLVTPGTTSLTMQSQPGDYVGGGSTYDFSATNATFLVTAPLATNPAGPSGIQMKVLGPDGENWDVVLVPGGAQVLAPGTYDDAARYPFNGSSNGLSVTGDSRGCNVLTGSFTVQAISFSPVDDALQHLDATFVQHCEGVGPELTGTVSYDATPVTTIPVGVSDLVARPSGNDLAISWQNPPAPDFSYTVIRLEQGSPVGQSPLAGQAVSNGTGSSADFGGVQAGGIYTVTAFTVDRYGNVGEPTSTQVGGVAPVLATAYTPLTPTRIADTRPGSGAFGSGFPLGPHATLTIPAGIQVPDGASAVALSVTAVDSTAPGFVSVSPSIGPGSTSVLNHTAGGPGCQTIDCVAPNLVIASLSSSGEFVVTNGSAGTTDVVVDVEGYFIANHSTGGAAGRFFPLKPARLADTRCGETPSRSGTPCSAEGIPAANAQLRTLSGPQSVSVSVDGQGNVPAFGVGAAVVDLTVTNTTTNGYLTAYADGTHQPLASDTNWVAGQTTSTRVIVP